MRTLIIAAAALLTAPAAALAASPLKPVPPSNSAANQYVEVVPTAGGGTPATGIPGHTTNPTGGSPAAASSPLPASTQAALASSGRDGRRVAQLARATAPARQAAAHQNKRAHSGVGAGGSGGSGGGGSGGNGASVGAAPVSAVVKSLTGSAGSGIGAGLPIALVLVALAISGVALARRRTA